MLFKNYFFISYHSHTSFTTILSITIIAATLIKLAEDWFYFNQAQNKIIRDAHQITQSQLTALRSQINPHFYLMRLMSSMQCRWNRNPQLRMRFYSFRIF